jgi:hypothetical protein
VSDARRGLLKTLPVFASFVLVTACNGAPEPTAHDGLGSSQISSTTAGPDPACSSPGAGCPCTAEGSSIACLGPRIQTGNYTTCTPGARFCSGGIWGACVGKTLYQNVDTVTQDFESPCPTGMDVVWTGLILQGIAPGDSRVDVAVQTAADVASLGTAPLTRVGSFDATMKSPWSGLDVNAALAASGQTSSPWLRVTIALVRGSQTSALPSIAPPQTSSQCVAAH